MANVNIVTLFLSGNAYENNRDKFIPTRSNNRNYSATKQRCQSAPFYSCLQPRPLNLSLNQIRPNTTAISYKYSSNKRFGQFQNEIDSAVKLMENRSQNDLINQHRSLYSKTDIFQSKINYKSHSKNISNDVRWKSACPRLMKDDNKTDRDYTKLKFLSSKDSKKKLSPRILTPKEDIIVKELSLSDLEEQPKFLTSNSNFLSRFITIDENDDIKKCWTEKKSPNQQKSKDATKPYPKISIQHITDDTIILTEGEPEKTRRNELLREFMHVYLDWKEIKCTSTTDQEMDYETKKELMKQYQQFQNLTPKQRLATFHNLLSEGRKSMKKQLENEPNRLSKSNSKMNQKDGENNSMESNRRRSSSFGDFLGLDDMKRKTVSLSISNSMLKDDNGFRYGDNLHVRLPLTEEESEKDDSDVISEIDWLEVDEF